MTSLESFYQRMPHLAEEETIAELGEIADYFGSQEAFVDYLDSLTKSLEQVAFHD